MQESITIKEAAQLLGVSPLTLRNWDNDGKLVAYRNPINNYRVYKISQIEKFIDDFENSRRGRHFRVKIIRET
ncbi:MAG: MerR family DNA-binding transcriptional regulator [Parcubacteria group bacterium]|nr:MerR family DNA-binding transcriptional regulator [Parcubacteria group bacterium]